MRHSKKWLAQICLSTCCLVFLAWNLNWSESIQERQVDYVDNSPTCNASCFSAGAVPYVLFSVRNTKAPKHSWRSTPADGCSAALTTILVQAVSMNGRGNVVLLEVGTSCRAFCLREAICWFPVPDEDYLDFLNWMMANGNSPSRMMSTIDPVSWGPELQRTHGPYYASYFRIFAIGKWLKSMPSCVNRITHIDVDTMVWASAADVVDRFPQDEMLAVMAWPLANHIYTSFSRRALHDFLLFTTTGIENCSPRMRASKPELCPEHPEFSKEGNLGSVGFTTAEFSSDMHVLSSYIAYNVSKYPCWALPPEGHKRLLGSCQHFFDLRVFPQTSLPSPYVRPTHVPRFSVGNLNWPSCRPGTNDCGVVSEAYWLDREGVYELRKTQRRSPLMKRTKFIGCQPYVYRLNSTSGEWEWITLLAAHMQGTFMKVTVSPNMMRPPLESKECQEIADITCHCVALCDNCITEGVRAFIAKHTVQASPRRWFRWFY